MSAACICGAELRREPFSENFDALRCRACATRRFVAAREGVGEFPYDSSTGKYSPGEAPASRLRWAHRRLLARDWRGLRVLEVGCFDGFFVAELRRAGAQAHGIDVNSEAVAIGMERHGLHGNLHSTLTEASRFAPFDQVVCIDALEHLDDPAGALVELKGLLKEDGAIVLAGPTIERGFHDKSDFPPHHKWWFSRTGLGALLERVRFQVASVEIERDAVLLARNAAGRLLHGWSRREYYGDGIALAATPAPVILAATLRGLGAAGKLLFSLLRISYCSTLLTAKRRPPA